MIINIHTDSLIPSLFETTLNAFKTGAAEVGKSILMNMIFSLKDTDKDFKEALKAIESDPKKAVLLDDEDFHDYMGKLEDMLEYLISTSEQHANDSDIFKEFNKVANALYDTTVTLGVEVSAIASEERNREKIAS